MASAQTSIAIIGATSHIAKNIIYYLSKKTGYDLCLYARNVEHLQTFLEASVPLPYAAISTYSLSEFGEMHYDTVINCIGIGDPGKLKQDYYQIFQVTEHFDNLVIEYLRNKSNDSLYINLSSGAAYGKKFDRPAHLEDKLYTTINQLGPEDFYGIAKVNSEAKHRSLTNYKIIDLRIFGFFSEFIDLHSRFLLSDLINCIRNNEVLKTNSLNIIRDYVSPKDFSSLIERCIQDKHRNTVYDVYSQSPVSKFQIIENFSQQFALKYQIKDDFAANTTTGHKPFYYSGNKAAEEIKYYPSSTSLESIIVEAKKILNSNG